MLTGKTRAFSLLAAILLGLAVAAYSNHFHNAFHFDDSHTVVNNLFIRSLSNLPRFFTDSTTFSSLPSNRSYRPVVSATLAIDYWLGNGLADTFYFHLSMFLLFVAQAGLMAFFYARVFHYTDRRGGASLAALLAAGWYLVHPANAETINYIISRSDSYSALFMVLAFALYIGSARCRRWHLYLIPLLLGLLTKPIAAVFPVLLFSYLFLIEQGATRPSAALRRALPAFVFTLAALAFIKGMEPPTWTPGGTSQLHYVMTQPYVILRYFLSFFLPIALSADTDLAMITSIADPRFVLGLLFLAALLTTAVLASARQALRPIAFGLGWFLVTLLPTSLIPLAEVMNDHRVFLPYVGLTMSVAWSAYLIASRFRARMLHFEAVASALITLLFVASAYGTHQRNEVWKTEEALWRDVTEKSPGNGRGLMNYGLVLMEKGDYAGAEKYFLEALRRAPYYATLYVNLGVLNGARGRPAQAEQYFRRAIALQPGYPEGYFFYARFLDKQNRLAEAAENLRQTLRIAASHVDARNLLMEIYQKRGDREKAVALARETLAIAPKDEIARRVENGSAAATPEYYLDLSLKLYRAGEFSGSIEAAEKALQLRPGFDLAYNNICAAHNDMKQWDQAIAACEKALKSNPDNALARNNLAWARQRKRLETSPGKPE